MNQRVPVPPYQKRLYALADRWADFVGQFSNRKSLFMLIFGVAAGLPFSLLVGTLNAWLGAEGIKAATIGILSWLGLTYAFKFLWSPIVGNLPGPLSHYLGRRRGWIIPCQIVIVICLWVISHSSPQTGLGTLALAAVIAAFASATQDIAVDAWRIEMADDRVSIDSLSTTFQFGYRMAALLGGAGALMLAGRIQWPLTFSVMAGLMALAMLASLWAPEPISRGEMQRDLTLVLYDSATLPIISPQRRNGILLIVLIGWAWSIWKIGDFMARSLVGPGGAPGANLPGPNVPSASQFIQDQGPMIVFLTILLPGLLAWWLNQRQDRGARENQFAHPKRGNAQFVADYLFVSMLTPIQEMIRRIGLPIVLTVLIVLFYRLTDSIWGPFAYPFYLNEVKYSYDEVAFASKIFGVILTIVGIALGGVSLLFIGRMPSLLIGAIISAATNLVYADLARGSVQIDLVLHATGLQSLFGILHVEPRMARLMLTIAGENLAGGYASAAYAAFLAGLVNKHYSAVQYALLSSLTLLVGSLGRAPLGEAIDKIGYARVFEITFALGAVGVIATLLEWIRQYRFQTRLARQSSPDANMVDGAKPPGI